MARRYRQSREDRRDESRGMKRYESSRSGGHAHKEKHGEMRNNSPMHYGSSNHGDGSYGGPKTVRMLAQEVAQRIEDWGDQAGGPMRQHESGSMDYLADKREIWREDDRRISKDMMPQ